MSQAQQTKARNCGALTQEDLLMVLPIFTAGILAEMGKDKDNFDEHRRGHSSTDRRRNKPAPFEKVLYIMVAKWVERVVKGCSMTEV